MQQIREELGEFDYDMETNHGDYPVEYRPMVELENHARYEGEWINDVQEGQGEETWADGAKYTG